MDEDGELQYDPIGRTILVGCKLTPFESQSDDCKLLKDRRLSSSFALSSDDLRIESRRGVEPGIIEC
jgi:hypothetical protein